MSVTGRIVERLPRFYSGRETNSRIYQLCDTFAVQIEEAKRNLFNIMRAHWIESSEDKDLDNLAKIITFFRSPDQSDLDFRNEILNLIELGLSSGGGTRESILKWLSVWLRLRYDSLESQQNEMSHSEIQIIENPEKFEQIELQVGNDDEWTVDSQSIEDEDFSLTIIAGGKGREIHDPEILVVDTEISELIARIKYNGNLQSGQRLVIKEDGHTELDGIDVTSSMVFSGERKIVRRPTTWKYKEYTSPKVGRFDRAKFDENFFQIDVPNITMHMEWKARQRATIEIVISSQTLSKVKVSKNVIQQLINTLHKAVGVALIVKIKDTEDRSS